MTTWSDISQHLLLPGPLILTTYMYIYIHTYTYVHTKTTVCNFRIAFCQGAADSECTYTLKWADQGYFLLAEVLEVLVPRTGASTTQFHQPLLGFVAEEGLKYCRGLVALNNHFLIELSISASVPVIPQEWTAFWARSSTVLPRRMRHFIAWRWGPLIGWNGSLPEIMEIFEDVFLVTKNICFSFAL